VRGAGRRGRPVSLADARYDAGTGRRWQVEILVEACDPDPEPGRVVAVGEKITAGLSALSGLDRVLLLDVVVAQAFGDFLARRERMKGNIGRRAREAEFILEQQGRLADAGADFQEWPLQPAAGP